uniref:mitotic spindle assembly checkpoint protein MAD2B-like n=1 Tax=Ciona intestinalis TaxID=7719 RepID=UPI0005219F32|nr:mitotic spindle assembly checkpoint protein MAD2B-like [Ciona intestinalis]|eukprot:XP_009860515.1 mitotic spindle assembly checkpoint protein MAD2B-like [Ciona intestinalis]
MNEDIDCEIIEDSLNENQTIAGVCKLTTEDSTTVEDEHTFERKKLTGDVTCEFLEVAFHQILRSRQVYPWDIFVARKKYNIPVFMSCYPPLNLYIAGIMTSVKPLIDQGIVKRVVLLLLSSLTVLEQFVFELSGELPQESSDEFFINVEHSFRAVLTNLVTYVRADNDTKLPTSFQVKVYVTSCPSSDLFSTDGTGLLWVKCEKDENKSKLSSVKSIVNSSGFGIQLFILENIENS